MDTEYQSFDISFPVFLIAENNSAVVTDYNDREWFLLYATKELAELYLEQAQSNAGTMVIGDVDQLKYVLSVDRRIAGFLWNATFGAQWTKLLSRDLFE